MNQSGVTIKTYENWEGSLIEYLKVGDYVDEAFVDHFVNELPPACMSNGIIQLGESYSFRQDKRTYHTLIREGNMWKYAGTCHIGQTIHLP